MAKRPKPVPQMTAAQFDAAFPDEDACKAYLVARRWPDGVRCPRCGNPKVYDLKSRQWHWQCEQCAPDGYRFSHIAGTIFENTNKPLRDWYKVAHLMLASKKGMSALQIMRSWASVPTKPLGSCATRSEPLSLRTSNSLAASSRLTSRSSAERTRTRLGWRTASTQASSVHQNGGHRCRAAQGQRGRASDRTRFQRGLPNFRARNGFRQSLACRH